MSLSHNTVTLCSYSSGGYAYVFSDAYAIKYTTVAPGGFNDLTFSVDRPISRVYHDLDVGYMINATDAKGQLVWEGMIINIEKNQTNQIQSTINVSCLGYSLFLATQLETATAPGGAAADIATYISTSITPMVTANYLTAAHIYNTGVNIVYSNPITTNLTTKGTVRGLLDKLYLYGDSSNNFMNWGVWDKREFWWLKRPLAYTLIGYASNSDEFSHMLTNDNQYRKIQLKYVDSATLQLTLYTKTQTANTYTSATTFNNPPANGVAATPISQVETIDITKYGPMAATQADVIASTMLNQAAKGRVSSNGIKFSKQGSILDVLTGGELPLTQVRAGNIILLPDLTNTDWSAMAWLGLNNNLNQIFIAKTTYDVDTNQLQIDAESGRNYDTIMSRLIAQSTGAGVYLTGQN